MNSFVISAFGEIKEQFPLNGSDFSLKELQDVVKGYIEIVPIRKDAGNFKIKTPQGYDVRIDVMNDYIMVVNSEGKLYGLECNSIATLIGNASNSLLPGDWIAGNVLICPSKMVK